jgi:hypothetical protein
MADARGVIVPVKVLLNPRFATRWLDPDNLQVDDVDHNERETWTRCDNGFRLTHSEPLMEEN